MVTGSRRICQVLIGLGDVNVLDVTETVHRPEITIETRVERPSCAGCGGVRVKDRALVRLVDLPCLGRSTVLPWRKRRWLCPTPGCALGSFTEDVPTIGAARLALADRAGPWVTAQVGGMVDQSRKSPSILAVRGTPSWTLLSRMAEN